MTIGDLKRYNNAITALRQTQTDLFRHNNVITHQHDMFEMIKRKIRFIQNFFCLMTVSGMLRVDLPVIESEATLTHFLKLSFAFVSSTLNDHVRQIDQLLRINFVHKFARNIA